MATGIVFAFLFRIFERTESKRAWLSSAMRFVPYAAAIALLAYPHFRWTIPWDYYGAGHSPGLYTFLQRQPKDAVIAALGSEADLIPTFAQRSVLVGGEFVNPVHLGYYRQLRERGADLVRAEYSSRLDEAQSFVRKYHVDFWIIDRRDFQPAYLAHQRWFKDIADAAATEESLARGEEPALHKLIRSCGVWENNRNIVLDAHRIEYVDPNLIE